MLLAAARLPCHVLDVFVVLGALVHYRQPDADRFALAHRFDWLIMRMFTKHGQACVTHRHALSVSTLLTGKYVMPHFHTDFAAAWQTDVQKSQCIYTLLTTVVVVQSFVRQEARRDLIK